MVQQKATPPKSGTPVWSKKVAGIEDWWQNEQGSHDPRVKCSLCSYFHFSGGFSVSPPMTISHWLGSIVSLAIGTILILPL